MSAKAVAIDAKNLAILGGGGLIPNYIAEHYPDALHITFGMDGSSKLGELGDVLINLKNANITHLCLIGSIKRPSITSLWPSSATRALIKTYGFTMSGGDDALLKKLKHALIGEGFEIVGAHILCPELLLTEGIQTKSSEALIPNDEEIKHHIALCKEYGRADKGQAIIVADNVMIDSEDKYGTNALISRNVASNAILVKASKPDQDMDFDMPTIGYDTVVNAHKAGIKSIVAESGATLFIEREKAIEYADTHHISIIGGTA